MAVFGAREIPEKNVDRQSRISEKYKSADLSYNSRLTHPQYLSGSVVASQNTHSSTM